jgi:uncharacterized membrane protein
MGTPEETQALTEFILTSLTQGKSEEQIYRALLDRGLTVTAIQEAFAEITPTGEREDTQKRTIRLILTIGAILIAAGVFSFIAANWKGMSRVTKVATIVSAMLVIDAGAWHFRERSRLAKMGEALLLLGSFMYGAGIFLVAQMFHMRANWPDGFILWMAGVIAMGFAADAFSLFYLAIPIGIVALVGYPMGIFGNMQGYNPFLLTSPLLLLSATLALLAAGIAVRKKMPSELRRLY